MIYALIDTRADDFFMSKIVWGDIHQVAEDMEVNVAFAVEGHDAFYTAFNTYKTRREQFANVELTPIMDETEENLQQLNAEIRSISSGEAFVEEYRYLKKNEAYEEQEEKVYS